MPNVKWATFSMTGSVWRRTRIRRFIGRSVPQSMVIVTANSISHISVIFLADEPTGNLDKKAADEIMELLLAVNRRGNTVLLVTHEQRYADLCGRKIEISDGRI